MKQTYKQVAVTVLVAALALPVLGDSAGEREPRGARPGLKSERSVAASADLVTVYQDVNKLRNPVSNAAQFYFNSGGVHAEWPKGSGNDALYRMNFMVGVPGNVVHTVETQYEEWNPRNENGRFFFPDSVRLATSTDSTTWPRVDGVPTWPVRDGEGEPVFVSQKDIYAVYDDSANALIWGSDSTEADWSQRIGVEVHQHVYGWNTALDEDYQVFRFDLVNVGDRSHDSLYVCMYFDPDVGGYSDDWQDDLGHYDLDRQAFWLTDADNTPDPGWVGPAYPLGMVFLETPEVDGERPGITDLHFHPGTTGSWPKEGFQDTALFQFMSSDPALAADTSWPDLFLGDDIHYDDPSLLDPAGQTLAINASSGPYAFEPGDTLTFVMAFLAGADEADLLANVDRVRETYEAGWQVKSVPAPLVEAEVGDQQVQLSWDNSIDTSYVDAATGTNTFMGYYVYRTQDPLYLDWGEPVDTLLRQHPVNNPDPPYFDGETGMYSWTDSGLINNFFYAYSVTGFDSSGTESGIANLDAETNALEVRPTSAPRQVGRLSDIRVVPNPFVISAQWERKRLASLPRLGEPRRELAFTNLPENATIRIYTVDGDHVDTIHHGGARGTAYWDLRNEADQLVTTGVYFYHVESGAEEHIGKFAVIR